MIHLKNIRRYRKVLAILGRHGLGWFVMKTGLGKLIPFHRGLMKHAKREKEYSAAEHLRMAFEDMGPTFIKLAQILSSRPDLVSPEYSAEFALLQDRVPPLPFKKMLPVINKELGDSWMDFFERFDKEPIASASIGQVYRAKIKSGENVVVKVQKPGIKELISKDLEILKDLIKIAKSNSKVAHFYDLEGFLDEFGFSLKNELDYKREGQNADRFRKMFSENPNIVIPKIYWEYSTSRILVMEEIHGIKANHLNEHPEQEVNRKFLAENAVKITLEQIFEHGFFHADPHPGNSVFMNEDTMGLMDFGMVGYIDSAQRELMLQFIYYMMQGDTIKLIDSMWELGIKTTSANRPALERDLNHFLFCFRECALGEIPMGDILRDFMSIGYHHKVYFPSELALVFKVLTMSEGLGTMLQPDFKLFKVAKPYLEELREKLFSYENVTAKIKNDTMNLLHLGRGFPQRIGTLLQRLESGELHFTMHHPGMEANANRILQVFRQFIIYTILTFFSLSVGIYILAGNNLGYKSFLETMLLVIIIVLGLIGVKTLFNLRKRRRE